MASTTATRVTARQFAKEFADVPFCELERGEVIHLSIGGWFHSIICTNIAFLLAQWAKRTRRGRVLSNEAGLFTEQDPDTVRGVDVMYFSYRRVPKGKEPKGFAKTPPELAVEVVGKGQGWPKMLEKAGEYFAMGVDRVWIVDPQTRTVHVHRAEGGEPLRLTEDDTLRDSAILPGFSCRVAEFFEV